MNLFPTNAFLFVPGISPIPMRLFELLAGRHIDLWFLEVLEQFGSGAFALTLAVPLALLAGSLALLRDRLSPGALDLLNRFT